MNNFTVNSETDELIKTFTCSYQYNPLIKIDVSNCLACHKCSDRCPNDILKDTNLCYDENENKAVIINTKNCSMCMKCINSCEPKAIDMKMDGAKFVFTIETSNSPTPKEVLKKAYELLSNEKYEN